jgi:hypothetical protein
VIVVGLLSGPESTDVADIARRAAGAGSKVELIGLVPGDASWDSKLFELAREGVGHATVVRSARSSMEAADLELALRYLPDIRCVVLASPPARLLLTAVDGADFAGAPLVIVGPLDAESLAALEARGADGPTADSRTPPPIVLDPPAHDPDGTFAGFLAALAVRLDAGEAPDTAFRSTVAALAVDPA